MWGVYLWLLIHSSHLNFNIFLKQFLTDHTTTQVDNKHHDNIIIIIKQININHQQLESTVCAIWGWMMRVDLRYRVLPAMEKVGHKKSNGTLLQRINQVYYVAASLVTDTHTERHRVNFKSRCHAYYSSNCSLHSIIILYVTSYEKRDDLGLYRCCF